MTRPRRMVLLLVLSSFLFSLVFGSSAQETEKDKRGVQVGQLFVTPIAAGTVLDGPVWGLTKPPKRGNHFVVVTVKVKNNSPYPNCTNWLTSLQTDSGKNHSAAIWRAPDPPEVERLPWRVESIGHYAFQVKDGENPVALVLERNFIVERECWGRKGFSPNEPFSTKVHIALENLPSPSLQPTKAGRPSHD